MAVVECLLFKYVHLGLIPRTRVKIVCFVIAALESWRLTELWGLSVQAAWTKCPVRDLVFKTR